MHRSSSWSRRTAIAMLLWLAAAAPAAAAEGIAGGPIVHSVLAVDSPLEAGEYLWEPERSPYGRVEIVADVARDRLYVYRGGAEIGRTILIFGDDEKPTPLGTFTILQKRVDHVSNLYFAEMPYMQRLTWDGIAIHGSGDIVDTGYATNGCLGVPDEFAALLYGVTRLGDRVTVTRNWLPEVYG